MKTDKETTTATEPKPVDVLVHFEVNGSGTVTVPGSNVKPAKFTNLKLDFKRAVKAALKANGFSLYHKSGAPFVNGDKKAKKAEKKAKKAEKKAAKKAVKKNGNGNGKPNGNGNGKPAA